MKIALKQIIQLQDDSKYEKIYKHFSSNVIPHKGDFIYDHLYEDASESEVIRVAINYTSNVCYVTLAPIQLDSNDVKHLREYVDAAIRSDWDCPLRKY
ncbi:hypothetical protein ACSVDA_23335 [Cytobacillus sp. Hm23]